MGAAVAAETVVVVVVVNVTFISTREILASHGTIKTHGTARMAEVEIMEDGDTTILRTILTLPQPKLRAIRTEGTRPRTITIIRTTNRAGIEHRLSHRMTHGLHMNSHPIEVVEGGIIQDMTDRTAAERMGILEGEAALLPIEEVLRMAVGGMAIREVRAGDMDTAVTVVVTTSPRRTAVTAEVVTVEAEAVVVVAIILVEAINPADHTALASSLTGAEEVTTKEVEVVGEGTDLKDVQARIGKFRSGLLRSMFSSCFELTLVPFGGIPTVILSIYYVLKHHM